MCGITGVYSFTEKGQKYHNYINDATCKLYLRGPDSSGIYQHNNLSLGHVRLSIIDVSDIASQPFSDITGRYTIIFNGEFYNFKEHRLYLEQKGYILRSQSDTEVLLYLYIEDGPNFISKLNGFFAFAIYDKLDESLFMARDRSGIKPILFYKDNDVFIFASEMKSLLAFPLIRKIDTISLFTYLQLNYIPAPHSIFEGINKLEPGCSITIKNNSFKKEHYYKVPYDKNEIAKASSYEDSCSKLKSLLDDSVKLRLISDVPLGAFLSGGIDSSVIVALASRHTQHLNTFSIGFKDEPLFDETYYARLVSKKFNTNHTEFKLTNNDLLAHLYDVLDYIDEPFADSSALAVYILSMQTKKHVTVALSGDGADEIFGGYNKHYAEYNFQKNPILMRFLAGTEPLLRMFPQSRNSALLNRFRQLHRMALGAKMSAKNRYWHWCRYADEIQSQNLLISEINHENYDQRKSDLLKYIDNEIPDLNDILYADVNMVLPYDMLTKVDLMSMANSLEVRVPFLDYRIVNFAFGLPASYKIDGNNRKRILKDTFKNELPDELYTRKKHGFEVPLLKWFNNELKSLITNDLLEDNFIKQQGLFSIVEIRKLKNQVFSDNPHDATARVWALIVFQYWWKKYCCQ